MAVQAHATCSYLQSCPSHVNGRPRSPSEDHQLSEIKLAAAAGGASSSVEDSSQLCRLFAAPTLATQFPPPDTSTATTATAGATARVLTGATDTNSSGSSSGFSHNSIISGVVGSNSNSSEFEAPSSTSSNINEKSRITSDSNRSRVGASSDGEEEATAQFPYSKIAFVGNAPLNESRDRPAIAAADLIVRFNWMHHGRAAITLSALRVPNRVDLCRCVR